MFKCYYTGIKIKDENAYILNLGESLRILRELKEKINKVEKLIKELGETEEV